MVRQSLRKNDAQTPSPALGLPPVAGDGREEEICICLSLGIDCFCEPRALTQLFFPGGGKKGSVRSGIRASAPLGDGPDPPLAWQPHLHLLFFCRLSSCHPAYIPTGGHLEGRTVKLFNHLHHYL